MSRPVVPIRVLKSQVKAYAAQIAQRAGTSGAELNALVPFPAPPAGNVYPGFSYVVAAYASGSATPGESAARRLLTGADLTHPDSVVFPDVVLTLLAADVYRAAKGHAAADAAHVHGRVAGDRGPVAVISSGSICSKLSDWTSQGFDALVKALTVNGGSSAAGQYIAGLWNTAVSLAHSALSNVVSTLTAPLLGAIQRGFSVAALASWAVSALANMKITTKATPPFNNFGVDPGAGMPGSVQIKVGKAGGFEFPKGLKDCANLLHIDLPSFNDVAGRTITWNLQQVHGTPITNWCTSSNCDLGDENSGATDRSLASNHTATFSYTTNTESADQKARGQTIGNDYLTLTGTVSIDKTKLAKLIKHLLLGEVPGGVKILAGPLVNTLSDAVTAQIAGLAEPTFIHSVQIGHHAIPALLPDEPCTQVYSASDFGMEDLGTNPSPTPQIPGTRCFYWNGNSNNPAVDDAALYVEASTTAAHALFEKFAAADDPPLSPVAGIGDEAAAGSGTCTVDGQTRSCGGGVVRVANDVIVLGFSPASSSVDDLLKLGVQRVCPDCQFPTEPAPS